jgi:predicted AlkP superfamily pyrophosphatase or phosphodiesterase
LRRIAGPLVLALLAGCSAPAAAPPRPVVPEAARAPRRPRLVVLIVVDQLSTWAFERDRPLYRGGFARLLREGAYVRAGELPYANTFTAPGHATIGTGAPPSVHGVVGNTWYRRDEGAERPAEYDPDAPPLPVGPSHDGALEAEDSASSRALRVEGVADVLRRATGGRARSVAISLKARSAVFVAGKRPDVAVWYEPAAGGMTTSRAFASAAPPWLVELARTRPDTRFFDQTWEPLDAALLARATGIPDDAVGEGSVHGLGPTFPHALAASDRPGRAILHTPYADELVMDAALAAIPALGLGADDVPDLLAVSFSAHDYAGHLWGPESWEVLDLKLRLDAALGRLFDQLDARLGRGGWAAVLTADHGVTPVVERSKVTGARRIRTDEIARAVEAVLEPRIGKGPWIAQISSGNVYFSRAFANEPPGARDDALTAAADAIGRIPGVATAARSDRLAGRCDGRAQLPRALCLSIVPGESGELLVVPAAGSVITNFTSGSHHDAPFDDNRRVPILVLAPGLAPQAGAGSLLQVAPTVAALLGIPPPAAASAPPLFGLGAR